MDLQKEISGSGSNGHKPAVLIGEENPAIRSVADLLDTSFPEPVWAIPGILPAGLTLFGGRPKVGKSWFMLQVAHAVSTGGYLFDRRVEKGSVLFISYEDSPRRLQERIRKQGIPREAAIYFPNAWQPLNKGGMEVLLVELDRASYRMVIIDTLTRAFSGVDQKEQHRIGPYLDQMQTLAINRNIAAVFLDHTRKPMGNTADPVDDIMNSTGKTGPADAIIALYKDQEKTGARLMGRGRDFEEFDYQLQWDELSFAWQLVGKTNEFEITPQHQAILDALEKLGSSQLKRIADTVKQAEPNAHKRLQELVWAGYIVRQKVSSNVFYELKEKPA